MRPVVLRPLEPSDLAALAATVDEGSNPFSFFGFGPTRHLERLLEADELITENSGVLAVETESGALAGDVGWRAMQRGPTAVCRVFNVGIDLLPEYRGQGYGSAAQAALAGYLFRTTLIERLEAGTDIDNVAEQRALEKAGFHREGVQRHAQFRAGQWRDVAQYSRLRGDPSPSPSAHEV